MHFPSLLRSMQCSSNVPPVLLDVNQPSQAPNQRQQPTGFFGFLRAGEFTCPSLQAFTSTMLSAPDVSVRLQCICDNLKQIPSVLVCTYTWAEQGRKFALSLLCRVTWSAVDSNLVPSSHFKMFVVMQGSLSPDHSFIIYLLLITVNSLQ